jgi:pimeloyl-ACP methyl ester carboxylesterase
MFMKKNLLLLHGALGSGQSWKQIIPLLADDFTVFCPDLPGHGSNDVPPTEGSPEQMVSFLKEYIEQNIAGDYVIAGYSMGGYIALKFATENPGHLKGIITIATKFDWTRRLRKKNLQGLLRKILLLFFIIYRQHTIIIFRGYLILQKASCFLSEETR